MWRRSTAPSSWRTSGSGLAPGWQLGKEELESVMAVVECGFNLHVHEIKTVPMDEVVVSKVDLFLTITLL